jgi:hypothetical protein
MTGARWLAAGGLIAASCMACGFVQPAGYILIFTNWYVLFARSE